MPLLSLASGALPCDLCNLEASSSGWIFVASRSSPMKGRVSKSIPKTTYVFKSHKSGLWWWEEFRAGSARKLPFLAGGNTAPFLCTRQEECGMSRGQARSGVS